MSQHEAQRLLTALGKARATFQTFKDAPTARGIPTILHGTLEQHLGSLNALNRYGQGIYHMVNAGDEQGRRAENVQAVTSYFVDLDGTPLFEHWPLPPTAIVESSPAKYHVYWRTTGAPLEVFAHVQKHLALLLDGDPAVHDLPRVLRLPGFKHCKAEPHFTSRLLTVDESAVFEHSEVIEAFCVPPAPPARRPLPPEAQAYIDRHQKRHQHSNGAGKPRNRDLDTATDRVMTAQPGERNRTLYRVAAAVAAQIKQGELNQAEAEERLKYAALAAGLEQHEITATIRSAMRHA